MAMRCSRSGWPMSATSPHSKREISRSSRPGISFGGRSEVSTICLWASNRALNVWKNSSCVISLPSRKCTSSTRKRSTSLRGRGRTCRPVDGGPDGAPWRHEEIHLRPLLAVLLHPEHHGGGAAEDALRGPREHARMLLLVPLHRELVRRADDQAIVIQRDRNG